jgi:hypothetical protein
MPGTTKGTKAGAPGNKSFDGGSGGSGGGTKSPQTLPVDGGGDAEGAGKKG